MAEEIKNPQETGTVSSDSGAEGTVDTAKYLEAIKQLKKDSVSRQEYEKLQAENKTLLDSIINGNEFAHETPQEQEPVDIDALRKDLFTQGNDMTNLEYVTKALELRDAIIEAGGVDPFLPQGVKIHADETDVAAANRVADVFKECIEYADGDSQLFTQELMRRTVDAAPARAQARKTIRR